MFGLSLPHASTLGVVCAALAVAAPARALAQTNAPAVTSEANARVREVSPASVAQQLGVKVSPGQRDDLAIGSSITGTLSDPSKLSLFGIANACVGARVTMMRRGEQRLFVEVDELEPVARTRHVTLRVAQDGQLSVPVP